MHKIKGVLGSVASSISMSYSKLLHYKYIIAGIIFFSPAPHTMENIALSISVPSFRTTLKRAIYWASKCLQWKDIEISNHYHGITKFTLAVDRAAAPAAALRRCARLREENQPTTISVIWTSPGNVTTNVAIWVEHLWIHTNEWKSSSHGSSIWPIASIVAEDFFVEKIFGKSHENWNHDVIKKCFMCVQYYHFPL